MKTDRRDPEEEERVVLVRPGGEHDITLLNGVTAPLRFVGGRTVRPLPLRIARELAGPGWWMEPYEENDERIQT